MQLTCMAPVLKGNVCGIAGGYDLRLKYSGTSLVSMGTAGDPLCPEQVVCASPMSAERRAFVPEMRKPEQCCYQFVTKALIRGRCRATNYLK